MVENSVAYQQPLQQAVLEEVETADLEQSPTQHQVLRTEAGVAEELAHILDHLAQAGLVLS